MKNIVFEMPNGTVCHCIPCAFRIEGEGDDAYLARVAEETIRKNGLVVQAVHYVNMLPEGHHLFKEGRRIAGSEVVMDMTVCRAVHMNRIRHAREPVLAKLDGEEMAAQGNPVKLAEVRARKQALRDIPQTFDLSGAGTPHDLDALWPDALPR